MAQRVKRPTNGGYRRGIARRDFAGGLVVSNVGDQAARRPRGPPGGFTVPHQGWQDRRPLSAFHLLDRLRSVRLTQTSREEGGRFGEFDVQARAVIDCKRHVLAR